MADKKKDESVKNPEEDTIQASITVHSAGETAVKDTTCEKSGAEIVQQNFKNESEDSAAAAGTEGPEPNTTETAKRATFGNDPQMEWLKKYFAKALGIWFGPPDVQLLDEVTFEGIARYMASEKCRKIVVMTGAGISTSAGIPDFRSPGTGVYDRLKEEYNIEDPQELFSYSFFKNNPEPYYKYKKELWRFEYKPTPCHYFIRLLEKKNKLLRHFTQNIDSLEIRAGISEDRLVQAHGTIQSGHCMNCKQKYTGSYIKELLFNTEGTLVPRCEVEVCEGVIRPDIVMFGENLPQRFSERICDLDECDLLLIMGTSLVVQPFANLPIRTQDNVPRLYINREEPKVAANPVNALFFGGGFDFGKENNIRDVFWEGSCDDGCYSLADIAGWGDELRQMVKEEHARLDIELGIKPETQSADSELGIKPKSHPADSCTPVKLVKGDGHMVQCTQRKTASGTPDLGKEAVAIKPKSQATHSSTPVKSAKGDDHVVQCNTRKTASSKPGLGKQTVASSKPDLGKQAVVIKPKPPSADSSTPVRSVKSNNHVVQGNTRKTASGKPDLGKQAVANKTVSKTEKPDKGDHSVLKRNTGRPVSGKLDLSKPIVASKTSTSARSQRPDTRAKPAGSPKPRQATPRGKVSAK